MPMYICHAGRQSGRQVVTERQILADYIIVINKKSLRSRGSVRTMVGMREKQKKLRKFYREGLSDIQQNIG